MKDILELLIEGIKQVSRDYYSCEDISHKTQYAERVFCYELYHQLRNLMPNFAVDWRIDGEITKYLTCFKDYGLKLKDENKKKVIPDLVIHEGQHTTTNDHLVIEVKNSPNKIEMTGDIVKLLNYVDEGKFNYSCGVYLQVNRSFDDLRNDIVEKLGNLSSEHEKPSSKIICMSACYDDHGYIIRFESLSSILGFNQEARSE